MMAGRFALLATALLVGACSYVGDVLGPSQGQEESEATTQGNESSGVSESGTATSSSGEADSGAPDEGDVDDSADWTDASENDEGPTDTLPPMEVTDVGGDEFTTWGEEGGLSFTDGFDGDAGSSSIEDAISSCQSLCDRLTMCDLLPPPDVDSCKDNCLGQVNNFAGIGEDCLIWFTISNLCAIDLSCMQLQEQLMQNPGAACADEFLSYQDTCFP